MDYKPKCLWLNLPECPD